MNILDTDNNNLGTCVRNTDPQVVECPGPYGNSGLANQFDCEFTAAVQVLADVSTNYSRHF